KSVRDARPESYNIRCDSIEVGETIPTRNGDWSQRADWIMHPGNVFPSLEALQEARKTAGTSIGVVKPLAVVGVHAERYPEKEKAVFWRKYRAIQSYGELQFDTEPERQVRP